MTSVRVGFVSAHVLRGGAERYLSLLLEELGPEWVGQIVFLADGPLVSDLRTRGLAVEVMPTGRSPAALARTARRLRVLLRGCEVVHADGVKAATAAVGSPVPLVWLKHDFSWDGLLAWALAVRANRVVGVSEAVLATFPRPLRRKAVVVHNGIPAVAVDRNEARARLAGEVDSGHLVGLVARLHPAKGQLELLDIAAELVARAPGTRILLIGGDDPSQPAYAARVRAAADRLGGAVRLLGEREDAATLAAGCDVVVVPSVPDERGMGREGFGYAALEAMAGGTPVVAYADGALPEVLGACGLFASPGDRVGLRDAILRLLGDPALRERLGACGRVRAQEAFDVRRTVDGMRQVYREAVGR